MVSIPRRYAGNLVGLSHLVGKKMFQFLVGTLEIGIGLIKFKVNKRFQFLVGTLEILKSNFFNSPFNTGFNSS